MRVILMYRLTALFLTLLCNAPLPAHAAPAKAHAPPAEEAAFSLRAAQVCEKQFSWKHKVEVAFNDEIATAMPASIEAIAKFLYAPGLSNSPYFDTAVIKNVPYVRSLHLRAKPDLRNVGRQLRIKAADGYTIKCTHFDRGSDRLVIVGGGFTNEREMMTPFVDMFDCDVLLFDFRGHGYESEWSTNLAKITFGIDTNYTTLGKIEHLDVFAVVDYFRALQYQDGCARYAEIHGVTVCYGSFIFLKAEGMRQALGKKLFDKITVDGCWESLPKLSEKIKMDPRLLCVPQTGGWKNNWLWSNKWARDGLEWVMRNVARLPLDEPISLLDYLKYIKTTPVMFFYGKDDLMVYRHEFEEIWVSMPSAYKVAVITSNPHVRNHLKQKELYKLLCEAFFALDINGLKKVALDPQELLRYHVNSVTDSLTKVIATQQKKMRDNNTTLKATASTRATQG